MYIVCMYIFYQHENSLEQQCMGGEERWPVVDWSVWSDTAAGNKEDALAHSQRLMEESSTSIPPTHLTQLTGYGSNK